MRSLIVMFVLLSTGIGWVRGDPNIYGPGGVNLGPNGELPQSLQELQQDKLLEEEQEQTRLLQQQVQELQQIQQQQEEMQWNQQNQSPIQIEINYGQPYSYPGWSGGTLFWGGGLGGVPVRPRGLDRHRGFDKHRGGGKHRGMVGHPSRGGGRGRSP